MSAVCRQQKGIALLTVLMVIVLATIAAVAMTSRQQIDIRRTENILRNEQIHLYLLGAEDWAKQVLAQDANDNDTDTLDDNWATILPPMPIEGGVISGAIEDMQGRFNINSLLSDDNVDEVNLARFQRLLQVLELSPQIADAVIDWLDNNEEPRPQGAEDNSYLNGELPYRAANAEMASTSELLYVKGIDFDTFQRLKPYIAALPGHTAININTSPAAVLASLAKDVTLESAQKLVEERGTGGYASVDEFLKHGIFNKEKPKKDGLAISSQHFLLSAQVIMGQSRSQL
ncbi:MAG: type II secretion system minor pseudopilin GspK, partial [Thioalkalispiraceae bacterium]